MTQPGWGAHAQHGQGRPPIYPPNPMPPRSTRPLMIVLLALSTVLALAIGGVHIANTRHFDALERNGVPTTGTVLSRAAAGQSPDNVRVAIDYVWEGRTRRVTLRTDRDKLGSVVQLLVDPHDPTNVMIVGERHERDSYAMAMLFLGAPLFWILIGTLLLAIMGRRH
jgi:hypothetical protein